MPVENTNTGIGKGGSGANTHAVPSNYAQSLASQIAQMNARQSQQASTSPNAASTAPTYASTVPTVSTPSPTAATTAYTNANTPAAQQYLALARAYGVPITQQAINNANSTSNPINRGIYGGYAQTPSTANHAAQAPSTVQPGLPSVDYQTFGTSAKVSFQDPHGSAFTATVELPGGNTFTYSGNVEGVPLGSILAKDQAVEQAWSAYQSAQQSLQNVPAGSSMTVTQGNNGLNLNINTAAGTSLPTQTVTVAPGLTFTSPTQAAATEAAAALLSSSFMNSVNPSKTYTSQGITFTGSQLQNMYESYESQINTALTQENPQVTVGSTTASFNSLTPAEQQQYVQQQTDNYLQSLQYNGAGYYNINGKNVYISNPDYYATMLGNGAIGQYEGTAAQLLSATTPSGWQQALNQTYQNAQSSSQNQALNEAYQNIVSGAAIKTPGGNATAGMMAMSPQEFVNDTTLTQISPGVYQVTTQFGGETYTQTVTANPSLSLNGNPLVPSAASGFTSSQLPNALSSQSIATGSMPIALPTPGTAGQYTLPLGGQLSLQGAGIGTALAPNTLTANNIASSQNAPFNPLSLSSWEAWGAGIPSDIASTFGNLISPITNVYNPGTPGGPPTAGGQFPTNYPITQTDINKLALTNPALAQSIQNQYAQLRLLSGTAYPMTMPNAAYTYLGSPSPTGPIFPNQNPAALQYYTPEQLKQLYEAYPLATEELALLLTAPELAALTGPEAALTYGLLGAGVSGVVNPLLTYAFSGGKATPQQLAKASAQGIVYGGIAGSLMPGAQDVASSLIPGATGALGRAATGALTNLAFSNTYNLLANGQPAGPWQDLFSAGLGAGVGYVGGLFKPTLAGPIEYRTILGVNPEAENVGVTFNPAVSEATEGAEGGTNAQLLKGSSYTEVTQRVYPSLLSRLLGRTATYQYLIPNLPEDLIQAGSEGIGTTEALSTPLYVRGTDGVWRYVTDVKIDPQVAISKLSDALKVDYNIENPEQATTETLPVLYKAMQEASEGNGIPFEGKIYQLDDFVKAIQGRVFENSNLPAIIGKDREPLTPKEVTQLLFDLKSSPPTDFIGTMWKGMIEGNPAILSQGTIYSQPSLFQRLLGNTQQNPQATFNILTLYLKSAAAEDGDIPAAEADTAATDAALKLTNNMIALQRAVNNYLIANPAPNMLPAGSAMPILTAGMNELEARLFSDLVAQGFLDPQGNSVSNANPTPTSGGTQAGNEGYIYIQNPDGTVTVQKVIQNPNEEQGEKELTKEEQNEAEKEENNQMHNEKEGEEQQTQIGEPGMEEGIQIIEPGTSEVSITEPGQAGKEGTNIIDLQGQKEGPQGENKVATTELGAEEEKGSSAEKGMQPQPIRVISKTIAAQKTIPAEIQKEAQQTTTPPIVPPTPTKKLILPLPELKQWFFPQERMTAINPYEAYASIYSPSLLPEVMPGLESLAEQEYSPMTALSTIRPLRAPSVNTPITLPSYATPTQPTIAEENLPGASNYYRAQSTPMAHVISGPSPTAATMATTPATTATPSYSFNEPFSNAAAATQVAPITDPAILQAISTAANPLSLGTLPSNAPPSAYSAIANPMLQSLNRLNMNALRLPNPLNSQTMAMSATSPNAAAPAFGFAGYSSPRIGNISLIPTAQDIMSVLGPEQMLRLLNQINPTKFSVTNIQYAPRSALAAALNNLSYSDIVLLMSEMSVPQRMMVYGLLGIPPGEALIIAQSGTQGLFIPSLSNALAATTRKRIVSPISNTAPAQPAPAPMPIININAPTPNVNRQLVTV